MVIKIVEKDEEYFTIGDLIEDIKKSQRVDEAGAIYSFEGIVRGTEENKTVDKLTLTLPDKEKGLAEIESIVETAKVKHGVFEIRDQLFLVVVLGPHRGETLEALTEVIERVKHEIDFKKEELSNQGTKVIMAGG